MKNRLIRKSEWKTKNKLESYVNKFNHNFKNIIAMAYLKKRKSLRWFNLECLSMVTGKNPGSITKKFLVYLTLLLVCFTFSASGQSERDENTLAAALCPPFCGDEENAGILPFNSLLPPQIDFESITRFKSHRYSPARTRSNKYPDDPNDNEYPDHIKSELKSVAARSDPPGTGGWFQVKLESVPTGAQTQPSNDIHIVYFALNANGAIQNANVPAAAPCPPICDDDENPDGLPPGTSLELTESRHFKPHTIDNWLRSDPKKFADTLIKKKLMKVANKSNTGTGGWFIAECLTVPSNGDITLIVGRDYLVYFPLTDAGIPKQNEKLKVAVVIN